VNTSVYRLGNDVSPYQVVRREIGSTRPRAPKITNKIAEAK
jgi:hypothetical protein